MGKAYTKLGIPLWCELWLNIHNDAWHDEPRENCADCQRMIKAHGPMPLRKMMLRAYAVLQRPERKATIPTKLRRQVFERDGYTCKYCGSTDRLSIDHIVAEVKGGPTTLENLQTLCFHCNCRKSDK